MSGAGAVKGREEPLDTWPPTSLWQHVLLYLTGTDVRGPGLLWWNQKQEKHSQYSKVGVRIINWGIAFVIGNCGIGLNATWSGGLSL